MTLSLVCYIIALLCFGAATINAFSNSHFDYFSGGVFFAFLGWLIASGGISAGS